jgi:hypothetical protein
VLISELVAKKKKKMKYLILLFLFTSTSLFAQISGSSSARNIMSRGARTSKAKLTARIGLDGNYQTGNTEKLNLSGTGFVAAIDSVKEFSANARFVYGEYDKTAYQREYIAGVQYDYRPLSDFLPFVRFEFYKNHFRQIQGRYSGLIGAKYRYFVIPEKLDYSISAAFLYDLDNFTADAELPNKERLRISVRPKFKHDFTPNIRLVTEIYYKPNLAHFEDYMIYWNSNINIRIIKNVLLRMSYEHEYNSMPASDKVKKTDAQLLAGLGIEFKTNSKK